MKGRTTSISSFNRVLALVALVATVFMVLFSTFMLSEHAAHHCNHADNCPICTLIVQCQQNIKTIGSGLIVATALFVLAYVIVKAEDSFEYQSVQTTLVSQKIRLDN